MFVGWKVLSMDWSNLQDNGTKYFINLYNKSPYDLCVYHSKVEDGSYIYLLLYVDNMLIVSRDKSEI